MKDTNTNSNPSYTHLPNTPMFKMLSRYDYGLDSKNIKEAHNLIKRIEVDFRKAHHGRCPDVSLLLSFPSRVGDKSTENIYSQYNTAPCEAVIRYMSRDGEKDAGWIENWIVDNKVRNKYE